MRSRFYCVQAAAKKCELKQAIAQSCEALSKKLFDLEGDGTVSCFCPFV